MPPFVPTFVHLLARRAASSPDRPLYTYLADGELEAGTMTYAQLDESARALARVLLTHAAPGDRAVLSYPVGLEYLVGFFACLYAGIIAVPAYPLRYESRSGGRIRTMFTDCRPRLVLTSVRLVSGIESALGELRGAVEVLATDAGERAADTATALPRIAPEAIAFLQYTSASTADAKGVCVTHANLMANQEMIRHAMAHDEQSHFVSWLPPYHDMGLVGNLLQPLYLGASCAFMPPAAFVQKPLRWLAAISKYRAHTSGAPNFAYAMCVKKTTPEEIAALDLTCWRIAYCGAETIDATTIDRFCAHVAPAGLRREAFYPCYGLAEATLMATGSAPHEAPQCVNVDPDLLERGSLQTCPPARGRRIVSCGAAPPAAAFTIVDPERLAPLPEGCVGEICVQGAHVASGYWNRAALSADVFEARVEGREGGFLRTGDLGAVLNGQLYVIGRIKELIVHQGRNLSPTDVEAVVEAFDPTLIDACAAFAVPGEHTEALGLLVEISRHGARHELAADTTARVAEAIAWDLYRSFDIMPARVAFAKKGTIPRTSSGKKQRLLCARLLASGALRLLADWSADAWQPTAADAEAGSDAGWLAQLIARFTGLSCEQIQAGPGGAASWSLDSLRAVELVHQIERRTGVALPLARFYESASLQTILREIESRRTDRTDRTDSTDSTDSTAADDSPAGGLDPAAGRMPVAAGQEAVWFAEQVGPGSCAFHLTWVLRLSTALESERVREAVRAVVARHEGLRCVFELSADEGLRAEVLPPGVVDYAFREERHAEPLTDWLTRECHRAFDLSRDLLVRVRHVRDADGDRLAFSLHHLVADAWSCALFTEEVLEYYVTGACLERPPSFRRYAAHVQRAAADEGSLRYWRERLASVPDLDPVDVLAGGRSRPASPRREGRSVASGLDSAASRALLESARQRQVSRQTLLLAAYGIWLWSLTRLDDFVTGCLASGRGHTAFARTLGLLTNPFAVRFRIRPETAFGEVIASVRDQGLAALAREDYPFQAVVKAMRPSWELGRAPLFQNMFVYQQLPASSQLAACVLGSQRAPLVHRGLTLQCDRFPVRAARYDFTLYAMEVEDRVVWEAVYDTDVLTHERVSACVARFDGLVHTLTDIHPNTPVGALAADLAPVV
jgi:acyl-CoA synthetase (AMP-forming)/AMP-acid ligase II